MLKVIKIASWPGRFGNKILTTALALYYGYENDYDFIELPKTKQQFSNTYYIDLKEDNDISLNHYEKIDKIKDKKIMPDFWDQDFYKLKMTMYKDKVMQKIKKLYTLPQKIKKSNEDTLHIHIRSGDIMKKNNGFYMVQPPLAYYCKIIEQKKWEKVIIVSEDTINPCINVLINKYKNVEYFGTNVLDIDLIELLSATNIVSGRGTFIPCLAFFMEDLLTFHYPNDGDYRIHHFIKKHFGKKALRHDDFKVYYKTIANLGGWNYSDTIKNTMLTIKN
tara:strand:- start:4349 stop:5179 length:831 start_codon:yes stop_codon:yes gene_type:complete